MVSYNHDILTYVGMVILQTPYDELLAPGSQASIGLFQSLAR